MTDPSSYFNIDGQYCGPEGPGEYDHCLVCGCTDADCSQCIEKTGSPCVWVAEGLCDACATDVFWAGVTGFEHGLHRHHNPYMLLPETVKHAEDWERGWDYAQRLTNNEEKEA